MSMFISIINRLHLKLQISALSATPWYQRSYFFCKFIQSPGVASNTLDRRNAISGVTKVRSFKILDTVTLDAPRYSDNCVTDIDKGTT